MNMEKLAKQYKQDNKEFIEEHKNDKILLNCAWSAYVDSLVRDGEVTLKQWQNLNNIF